MAVRSHHLENLVNLIGKGVVSEFRQIKRWTFSSSLMLYTEVGGVTLTPESIESATSAKKMTGSMLVFHAESIDKVKAVIESDIYYTTGVVSAFRSITLLGLDSDCMLHASGIQRS